MLKPYEAATMVQQALPDAEVRLFDCELSIGVKVGHQAWKGDYERGFDIRDVAQVRQLIEMASA